MSKKLFISHCFCTSLNVTLYLAVSCKLSWVARNARNLAFSRGLLKRRHQWPKLPKHETSDHSRDPLGPPCAAATSTMATYLVDERRFPHPVEYPAGAPTEHLLLLLTPGEVPTLLSHAAMADGVVVAFTTHDGFTLTHAAALFGKLAALRTLPVITSVTSQNMAFQSLSSR